MAHANFPDHLNERRMTLVSDAKRRPIDLNQAHLTLLRHDKRGGIVSGFERWWDRALIDLEAWGMMRGTWTGSLDGDPFPFWSITKAGEDALRDDDDEER